MSEPSPSNSNREIDVINMELKKIKQNIDYYENQLRTVVKQKNYPAAHKIKIRLEDLATLMNKKKIDLLTLEHKRAVFFYKSEYNI